MKNQEMITLVSEINHVSATTQKPFSGRVPYVVGYAADRTIDALLAEHKRVWPKVIEVAGIKEQQKLFLHELFSKPELAEILEAECEVVLFKLTPEKQALLNLDALELTGLERRILTLLLEKEKVTKK